MKTPLFLFIAFFFISCEGNDDDGSIDQVDCPTDLICTEEFRTLTIIIEDNEENRVALDSFVVTIIETGEELVFEDIGFLETGRYQLADDGHFDKFEKEGTSVIFEGFLDGEKVIEAQYLVGHDCCHVVLIEGDENLILD